MAFRIHVSSDFHTTIGDLRIWAYDALGTLKGYATLAGTTDVLANGPAVMGSISVAHDLLTLQNPKSYLDAPTPVNSSFKKYGQESLTKAG